MTDICDFCGKEKEVGDSTPFHGFYCMDCMKMNIQYDKESIAGMKSAKKKATKKKVSEDELSELERAKDEALDALMNFNLNGGEQ